MSLKGALISTDYRVALKPLTPLHVWSGDEALLGFDAVYRAGKLCIIDLEALPEEVVKEVASRGVDARKIGQMMERFADRLPCKLVASAKVAPKAGNIKLISKQIVPGSSVKGYMRMALMYYIASKLPKEELVNVLNQGVNLEVDPRRASQDLERQLLKAPRPKGQGGFVDSLQELLVSDPEVVSAELALDELGVYKLPSLERIANVYAITFSGGELRYRISVLKSPRNPVLRQDPAHGEVFKKLSLLEGLDLVGALREFGCALVEAELSRVRGFERLEAYAKTLESYKERYCGAEGDRVIARLGFMTGHQAKTMLGLVKSAHPKLYNEVKATLSRYYGHVWDELTLKLVNLGDKGLVGIGWCELCVEKA